MSKESMRAKIEKLKKESDEILLSSEISKEVRLFITSMMFMIDVIVDVLLTKKVRKNSSNSGLPPSQNFGSNGNRNSNIDNGKDKKGEQVGNTRNVTIEETVSPRNCKSCDKDLTGVAVKSTEVREEIDIIYEIKTTEITSEEKKCDVCGTINKGQFPKGMDGKVQYGLGIRAAIINYLIVQMMSLEKVEEHLKGLIGRFISQATMLKYIFQLHTSLELWEKTQVEKLLKFPVLHVDETSLRINKKNHWIHVYTYGDISLQFVHPKRGIEAVDDIDIIPRYGGIIVHDCWATYFHYKDVNHALCGGHILRELKYVEDQDAHFWATMMKEILQEAAEVVSGRPHERVLHADEYVKFQKRYREVLNEALYELPPFPEKVDGKKGKVKHTDAQNLWLRLKKYESSVLMFARVKEVDFTNNRAERDIRGSKTKQKVSGGFRTLKYAEAYVRITSFVKSMRYRGYSSFQSIHLALNNNIPT